jgi:hypothetical protein
MIDHVGDLVWIFEATVTMISIVWDTCLLRRKPSLTACVSAQESNVWRRTALCCTTLYSWIAPTAGVTNRSGERNSWSLGSLHYFSTCSCLRWLDGCNRKVVHSYRRSLSMSLFCSESGHRWLKNLGKLQGTRLGTWGVVETATNARLSSTIFSLVHGPLYAKNNLADLSLSKTMNYRKTAHYKQQWRPIFNKRHSSSSLLLMVVTFLLLS